MSQSRRRLASHVFFQLIFVCSFFAFIEKAQAAAVCKKPKVISTESNCCTYTIKDQSRGLNEKYRQPKHAFSSESAAQAFYATVKAPMPFVEPFSSGVKTGGGWYYNSGGFHAAVDYSKSTIANGTDPSFAVRSIGAGKVISVYWDNWFGNTIVIEHKAKGKTFRSLYLHMRDGFSHDLAKARAISVPGDAANDSNWRKYKRYADRANPSTLQWGSNAQKIKVAVGAQVKAGQIIGWAGNTGAGGAGNGLNTNGSPKNTKTANNHLHLFMAVKDPGDSAAWLFVDPYGAYGKVNDDCYKLFAQTKFKRLFATHNSSFHNVDARKLTHYFDYYPAMGKGLQTISLHRRNGKLLASGSFQSQVNSKWYARLNVNERDYVKWFKHYSKKGYYPRELSVDMHKLKPRYTAIWAPTKRPFSSFHKLTDAEFSTKWNLFVKRRKYRVAEHFSYRWGGKTRHAVVFIKDSKPFYFVHNYKPSAYNTFFKKVYKKGFRQFSLQAEEKSSLRIAGLFLKSRAKRPAFFGMTASGYQKKYTDFTKAGYKLIKVQGYANSSRFSAIWSKARNLTRPANLIADN